MSSLALYVVSVLIWGSTWLAINFQLGEVASSVSLVYRYVLAAGLLFCWCLWRERSLRFDAPAHLRFAAMGLFLFGINYIAAYNAQLYISSALNAIGFSAMLWMNIVNSRIFFGTRIEMRVYIGAALGMTGIALLFWPAIAEFSLSPGVALGAGLSLGGAFVASLGNMVSQRTQREGLPVLQSNAWGMFYGGVFNALVALGSGAHFGFDTSPGYVWSLLYLAVFGSIVAFGAYLTLLGRIGAHRAGYAVVMFPIVALVLAMAFEDLSLDLRMLSGIALALAGNIAILSRHRSGQPGSAVEPLAKSTSA